MLSLEKQRQKAKSTIHISGGKFCLASEHEVIPTAINQLSEKLAPQLIKKKVHKHPAKLITTKLTLDR